jgi:hypothetical protein
MFTLVLVALLAATTKIVFKFEQGSETDCDGFNWMYWWVVSPTPMLTVLFGSFWTTTEVAGWLLLRAWLVVFKLDICDASGLLAIWISYIKNLLRLISTGATGRVGEATDLQGDRFLFLYSGVSTKLFNAGGGGGGADTVTATALEVGLVEAESIAVTLAEPTAIAVTSTLFGKPETGDTVATATVSEA